MTMTLDIVGDTARFTSKSPMDTYTSFSPDSWFNPLEKTFKNYCNTNFKYLKNETLKHTPLNPNDYNAALNNFKRTFWLEENTIQTKTNLNKIIGYFKQAPFSQTLLGGGGELYNALTTCPTLQKKDQQNAFKQFLDNPENARIGLNWYKLNSNTETILYGIKIIKPKGFLTTNSLFFTNIHFVNRIGISKIKEEKMYCSKDWLPLLAHYYYGTRFSKLIITKNGHNLKQLHEWKRELPSYDKAFLEGLKKSGNFEYFHKCSSLSELLFQDPATEKVQPFLNEYLASILPNQNELIKLAKRHKWAYGKEILEKNSMPGSS